MKFYELGMLCIYIITLSNMPRTTINHMSVVVSIVFRNNRLMLHTYNPATSPTRTIPRYTIYFSVAHPVLNFQRVLLAMRGC